MDNKINISADELLKEMIKSEKPKLMIRGNEKEKEMIQFIISARKSGFAYRKISLWFAKKWFKISPESVRLFYEEFK